MRIKSPNNKLSEVGIIFTFLVILLIINYSIRHKEHAIEARFTHSVEKSDYQSTINFHQIIVDGQNKVFSNENVDLFLTEKFGISNLIFCYKNPLEGKQFTNRFYLHLILNDRDLLKNSLDSFLILDFNPQKPTIINIDNKPHTLFLKELRHNNVIGEFIDIDQIKMIEAGRFNESDGVSESYGYNYIKGEMDESHTVQNLEKMMISISSDDFNSMKRKRQEALDEGILVTKDSDVIFGKVYESSGNEKDVEFRLKGDWTDHLDDERKWSMKFTVSGNDTFRGLRKFSIQHPKVRNYIWEWLFQKSIKSEGLIGLRYEFVNVDLSIQSDSEVQIIPLGIMALEESFDKLLIENNQKREGVILSIDESILWDDRLLNSRLGLDKANELSIEESSQVGDIKVYNQKRVFENPVLLNQFLTAKDLVDGVRLGKISISDAFDIEKLSAFVALSNIFGAKHGLISHNLKIYYNPISNKLEPIAFDANPIKKLTKIEDYPFSSSDQSYRKMLMEKLKYYVDRNYSIEVLKENEQEIARLTSLFRNEFGAYINMSYLNYNINFIKKYLRPSNPLSVGVIEHSNSSFLLSIQNHTNEGIELIGLSHLDGKILSLNSTLGIIPPRQKTSIQVLLNSSFTNAFVSKKIGKGGFQYPTDIEKIKFTYRLVGLKELRETSISPYSVNNSLTESLKIYQNLFRTELSNFNFVEVDNTNKIIRLKKGNHTLHEKLIIPKNYKLVIEKGFNLDIKNGAYLVSYSTVSANGIEKVPIHFYSSDQTGGGIFISNTDSISVLDHCYFTNLSSPKDEGWQLSGAVSFYEANVKLKNCFFKENRSEDALNIIKSNFSLDSLQFISANSDAFDGDFSDGTISNCFFQNCGNDAIDVSGSKLIMKNIFVTKANDKGISGGESSKIFGSNVSIIGSGTGLVSKDNSLINLTNVNLEGNNMGISAFQKKAEFGAGQINLTNVDFLDNELNYLIEDGSILTLEDIPMPTVSVKIADQLYEKK